METASRCACLKGCAPSFDRLVVVCDADKHNVIYRCTECETYWECSYGTWKVFCFGDKHHIHSP